MTVSLDLHGYSTQEAIGIFVGVYNEVIRLGRGEKIVVIHGFHGHTLRDAIRTFLSEQKVYFTTGEQREGNHGRTIIVPNLAANPIPDDHIPRIELNSQLPMTRRRYIFQRIVTLQDEGASANKSWNLASVAFGVSNEQAKAIQKEGIEERWPPLDK